MFKYNSCTRRCDHNFEITTSHSVAIKYNSCISTCNHNFEITTSHSVATMYNSCMWMCDHNFVITSSHWVATKYSSCIWTRDHNFVLTSSHTVATTYAFGLATTTLWSQTLILLLQNTTRAWTSRLASTSSTSWRQLPLGTCPSMTSTLSKAAPNWHSSKTRIFWWACQQAYWQGLI